MKTFYGSFRALEQKFITYLAALNAGPQRAVLVLCPSGRVATHLRQQLALKEGIISNVHIQTLSQLVANLDNELSGPRLPLLPGDNLHDYILKTILSAPSLDRYRLNRNFLGALKSSLRDLADGLVSAEVLEEYLQTTQNPRVLDEIDHLRWLTEVFKAYQAQMECVAGYRSYQTYFSQALAQAEKSVWLHSFTEIIWYGFYDLTGRQLELLQSLRSNYPLTVFWLYQNQPAFAFGRKFFETNLMGSSTQLQALTEQKISGAAGEALSCLFTTQTSSRKEESVQIVSAPTAERELFFVAKEILHLHEEKKVAYKDMAVVAHSLEPYQAVLPSIFAQHHIALQMDLTYSWMSRPLGVFLINLLSLRRRGFDREDVLAVIRSPYFKRTNKWRYVIERSLAKRDYAQWLDLVRADLPDGKEFLEWLENTETQLRQLEQTATWEQLCKTAGEFLQKNVRSDNLSAEEQRIWQELQGVLNGFARYTEISLQAQEHEFLDELFAGLKTVQIHQGALMPSGVTVADVSAMRGLHFKVVFLLGMNEKSFPQIIREDPILKDYYRCVFRDQLGFWLNAKLARFDEEKLLFYNIVQAAEEQLYLCFLRRDEEGKPLVPSSYLVELARAVQINLKTDIKYIPFHWEQNISDNFTRLTAKELSLSLAMLNAPLENYQTAGLLSDELSHGWEAAKQIASVGTLTERDGIVNGGEAIFASQNASGFSPSALQELAHCPFRYFLAKGIGLKEPEDILSRSELAANTRGTAYHEILKEYYQQLYEQGLSGQLFDSALQVRLDRAIAKYYTPISYKAFGIYPVIWDLILTDIHDKLSLFVQKDAEQMGTYIPSIFETYFEKIYAPVPELKLKLKGIIDRIDIDSKHKTFRIVDYKSGRHGGKDLAADMFKYVILQPFIYLLLARHSAATENLEQDGAVLLNIHKGYARQELSAAGFEALQDRAAQFFILLVQLVKQGRFFIQIGDHCTYCPYTSVCRKDSFYTRLRVQRDQTAKQLEEARQ